MTHTLSSIRRNWVFNQWQTVIIFLIGFFMSFCMIMFSDMRITASGSFSLLSGHILDMYDYGVTRNYSPELVYYPTMYWIFAIWNIPMALLFGTNFDNYSKLAMTITLYWDKVMVLIAFAICLHLFNKLCSLILDEEQRRYAMYFFALSPYLLIAEIAFGTYDYLYMVFVLWGVYIYFRDQDSKNWWIKFTLLFAISFTIKQLTIFIWLPLLLYREKRIIPLALNAILGFSFYIIETALFFQSPYFHEEVLESHFILFLTNMTLNNGRTGIALWGIVFGIICCFAYFKDYDVTTSLKAILLAMLGPLSIILCCHWTINWILLYMPFLAILIASNDNRERFQLIDFGFCGLYILMLFYQQTNYWGYVYYGEGMLDFGPLSFLRNSNDLLLTSKLVPGQLYPIILGALYSILIFYVIALHPKKECSNNYMVTAQEYSTLWQKFVIGSILYIAPIIAGVIL